MYCLVNTFTMAEAIIFSMRGAVNSEYPLRYEKTEKELQPEGHIIFGQFLPLSSLTDHKGYATLIVRWNCLKSKHSIAIVFTRQDTNEQLHKYEVGGWRLVQRGINTKASVKCEV